MYIDAKNKTILLPLLPLNTKVIYSSLFIHCLLTSIDWTQVVWVILKSPLLLRYSRLLLIGLDIYQSIEIAVKRLKLNVSLTFVLHTYANEKKRTETNTCALITKKNYAWCNAMWKCILCSNKTKESLVSNGMLCTKKKSKYVISLEMDEWIWDVVYG